MRVEIRLRTKKEEYTSGVENNTAHSTSIHIASLKQMLELLIKKPTRVARDLSAGDKSEKENTTACCLLRKRTYQVHLHIRPVSGSIPQETVKEFACLILFSQQTVAKGFNHVVRALDTPCFC